MKLYIDTNDLTTVRVEMTPEEKNFSLSDNMQELTFGLAGLASEYLLHIKSRIDPMNMDKAAKALDKLFSATFKYFLENGALDDDDDDAHSASSNTELKALRTVMEDSGNFTQEEINTAVQVVLHSGSIENAVEYLKGLAAEKGIDLDE